ACGRYVPVRSPSVSRLRFASRSPANCSTVTWSTPAAPLFTDTPLKAARNVPSEHSLSIRLYHLPPLTPSSRAASIRFVQTVGSVHVQSRVFDHRTSPAWLAVAGTSTGVFPPDSDIASPSSCTPSLPRSYPASTLLWVL